MRLCEESLLIGYLDASTTAFPFLGSTFFHHALNKVLSTYCTQNIQDSVKGKTKYMKPLSKMRKRLKQSIKAILHYLSYNTPQK